MIGKTIESLTTNYIKVIFEIKNMEQWEKSDAGIILGFLVLAFCFVLICFILFL